MRKVLGGRYELLSEAARGGMSSVHRARDLQTGRLVAAKMIAIEGPMDFQRFQREAALLADVDHPKIVRYVTHGVTEERTHYLVQEWVEGITLDTRLQTLGLDAVESVEIAASVGDALGAVHALGIVHRDVKPANVILAEGSVDRIKLVDFGIARRATGTNSLTRTGALIGTPSYMSPEQVSGTKAIDASVDVWGLGCVLYEALSGRKAFSGRTSEAVRAKIVLSEPEPLDAWCTEASPALVQLVHQMLSKRSADRPATGDDAAAALRAARIGVVRGSRRKVRGGIEQPTLDLAKRRNPGMDATNSFVFLSVPTLKLGETPPSLEGVQQISNRLDLDVHELDEGSLVLAARDGGKSGALSAASAALELKEQIAEGAICVFATGKDESVDAAIERGARALEEVALATLFADVLPTDANIRVDGVVADLVNDDYAIVERSMLIGRRHKTG